MQQHGCILWFTGLSGAGKSTLSEAVARELRAQGVAVEVLDGDEVRENLSKGLSFSKEDRDTNVRRIAFVANLLAKHGVDRKQFLDAYASFGVRTKVQRARELAAARGATEQQRERTGY